MDAHLLYILAIALVVICLAKFVFHLNGKKLVALIVNAVIGFVVIWLINWTGLIHIPLNIITSLVVGVFGVPGVVVLIVLVLLGVI